MPGSSDRAESAINKFLMRRVARGASPVLKNDRMPLGCRRIGVRCDADGIFRLNVPRFALSVVAHGFLLFPCISARSRFVGCSPSASAAVRRFHHAIVASSAAESTTVIAEFSLRSVRTGRRLCQIGPSVVDFHVEPVGQCAVADAPTAVRIADVIVLGQQLDGRYAR